MHITAGRALSAQAKSLAKRRREDQDNMLDAPLQNKPLALGKTVENNRCDSSSVGSDSRAVSAMELARDGS